MNNKKHQILIGIINYPRLAGPSGQALINYQLC
jgi:hypothetical protein